MDGYLEAAWKVMHRATEGMDVDALARHRPGKWSLAEIIEHLTRTFTSTVKLMERQMASGQPDERRRKWSEWIISMVVVRLGYMPSGRKSQESALPQGANPGEVVAGFREALGAMDEAITRCERKFGSGKIASHAILGPLTAPEWRKFHLLHTRHHARQVEALRKGKPLDR